MLIMRNTICNPFLTFATHDFTRPVFSEQLGVGNKLAHVVAHPLFDAGIHIAAITERTDYADAGFAARRYHEMRLLLQGKMTVVMRDRTHYLSPGDLVVSPSGTPVRYTARNTPSWWLYFQIADVPEWQALKDCQGDVRPYEAAPLMFLLLRDILDALAAHKTQATLQAIASATLLAELLKLEMRQASTKPCRQDQALQDLVKAITREPSGKWDLDTMSTFLHLSGSQATRLFKSKLGVTPKELVIRQRMKAAVDLLINSERKIADIAFLTGYHSLHSFTRLFRQHVGIPPGEYRTRFGLAIKP